MNPRHLLWLPLGLLFVLSSQAAARTVTSPRTIEFPSEDGLEITADLYLAHEDKKTPFIVLFHQARWSRGEYREIAPKLNAMGYNCMAVDLRSGRAVNDVTNKTHQRARAADKGATYLDALQDVRAALRHARKQYASGPLIAWGSSYSASLVLVVAGNHPKLVDAVLAFSPGEYFRRLGKPATWVRKAARSIRQPVFITSARGEKSAWKPIFAAIPSKHKVSYLPPSKGHHGSRALWAKHPGSDAYWEAVEAFLQKNAAR